jgi:hypothetical protein
VQAQLHQVRNDTNLVESHWVGSREQLPQPQYSWEAANGGSGGPAPGQWRKVRFGCWTMSKFTPHYILVCWTPLPVSV